MHTKFDHKAHIIVVVKLWLINIVWSSVREEYIILSKTYNKCDNNRNHEVTKYGVSSNNINLTGHYVCVNSVPD